MVVAHEAARQRTWWLVPAQPVTFTLTAGLGSYVLSAVLGNQAPDGVQFPIMVVIFDAVTGIDIQQCPLVRRKEWELRALGWQQMEGAYSYPDNPDWFLDGTDDPPQVPDPPQTPAFCYIDRTNEPVFMCYPPPDTTRTYGVRILFQAFSTDFTAGSSNTKKYNLLQSMNLWVVTALAKQIGNGPVRKLPADEVQEMRQEAQQLRDDLEAYANQEQASEPRQVAYYDF
jgi:hypothetical protein